LAANLLDLKRGYEIWRSKPGPGNTQKRGDFFMRKTFLFPVFLAICLCFSGGFSGLSAAQKVEKGIDKTGEVSKKVAKKTARGAKKVGKETGEGAKAVGKETKKAGKYVAAKTEKAGKGIVKTFKKIGGKDKEEKP
jgi:hypothetical protein